MHNIAEIPVSDILVIDDHVLVAEGFKELLLKILPSGSRVDALHSIDKAKLAISEGNYKFVITDLLIPGQDALEFISFCRNNFTNLVIIVITGITEANSIIACLTAGANGYLSKAIDPLDIKLALEYTFGGKKFISNDLSGKLAESILSTENTILTNKELEIIRSIASGNSTKVTAEMLFISPITVMTHKRNILRKLGLHSATEMVKYAYDNNLV
ncbi:LuxR C-terminal-related transcriptional regulator [Dyadobacter aurulentus]|uniref:LuxR C-terminal-related transcriptional regulator n=1 Tax=Dyadobacter sp. UC 10 TaxID=2605428 RepID=UPI0011F1A5F1|nr:response regulator transcription factor [Dyadobacter sp. UC 10]KAA0992063.1 response regulator transcription factor [Dyadobacter sp. UC 10]